MMMLMMLVKMITTMLSVVETVEKRREPMPAMEAIYLITPTESSVKVMMVFFICNYYLRGVYFDCIHSNFNCCIFSRVSSTTSNPKIEPLTRLLMSISLKVKFVEEIQMMIFYFCFTLNNFFCLNNFFFSHSRPSF